MDIHLADGSAFKIFEQVEIDAPVVFTTAYDEYALQAFQVSSIDYLLKPVTLASLERALNKLRLFDTEERLAHIRQTNRTIQSRHTIKSLLIMLADKFYPLAVEEILYFYTANEKVTAYTSDGKQHPVDRTLGALGEQLDERLFSRANRQFIISRNAIKDIDLWFGSRLSVNLTLPVPERIIISKAKTPIFKKWILRKRNNVFSPSRKAIHRPDYTTNRRLTFLYRTFLLFRGTTNKGKNTMLKCITFDGDASTLNTLMGYFEKLDKALADVHQVLSKEQTERPIFVREGSKIIRLRREEILFLEDTAIM